MICLSVLILIAVAARFVWQVPKAMRLLSAHLIARSVELEEHEELLRHWKGTLGVGDTRACETIRELKRSKVSA